MSPVLAEYALMAWVLLGVAVQLTVTIVGGRRGWSPKEVFLWVGLVGLGTLVVMATMLGLGLGPSAMVVGVFAVLAILWYVGFAFLERRRDGRRDHLGPEESAE